MSHPVEVRATPVAGFTPSPSSGCIDLEVAFENTTTGADFSQWDFGDGKGSTMASPTHAYAANGTYDVMLTSTEQAPYGAVITYVIAPE